MAIVRSLFRCIFILLLMLGHVTLDRIDRDYPVSFSSIVARQVIREDWQHDGLLISYERFYRTKHCADQACREGLLDEVTLKASDARQQRLQR